MFSSLRSLVWSDRSVIPALSAPDSGRGRLALVDALRPLRAASGYSLLTGIGLALGLAREIAVASTFGLSPQLDVFIAVMSLQLFFGTQLGNALETAFISRVAKDSGHLVVRGSLRSALYGLTVVHAGVVVFLLAAGGLLFNTIFPQFDGPQQSLGVRTLHLLILPIVFASTAGLLRGALSVLRCFAPQFVAGSLVSLCTIASVLSLSSRLGIDALTLGVAAGNLCVLLLFAFQVIRLSRCEESEQAGIPDNRWFALWTAAGTVLTGELIYSAVALTERSLASWLPSGSIAAFFYASTIVSVPLTLVVIPLTTLAFPDLVATFGKGIGQGLAALRKQTGLLLGASLVVVAVVEALAEPIVKIVFVRGQFSPDHAHLVASILSITICALPFMSLGRALRNSCYALADFRTPVAGLAAQWLCLAGLGAALLPRMGPQGLALALVAGEAASCLMMAGRLTARVRST
jgi:putative peptidoglycan lipid II flippase